MKTKYWLFHKSGAIFGAKEGFMKNIVVISASMRPGSNSDMMAEQFVAGAKSAGNHVEKINLAGKDIKFCRGCLTCQSTGKCVLKDDVADIEEKVLAADVVVWATPIYYYEMSGQMKVMIDRLNPMYTKDYKFRDVYLLCTAAEDEEHVPERAISGLGGWIDCFPKCKLKEVLFCGGVTSPKDIANNPKLKKAFELGASIK